MTGLYKIRIMCGSISLSKITLFIVGLSLWFISSCYYDPDDKYWVDLQNPAVPPEVNIDFNINSDTVYFSSYAPVVLKITASNENVKVESTKLYLDNEPVSYITENGAFIITPFSLGTGIHKFRMEFLVNSGTTSIADKLGAEMFEYKSRELTFIVQTPTEQSKWIKETESASGLTLTWNSGLVFNQFELRKTISIRSNSGFFLLDAIYTASGNTFTDTQYIGESATYQIYGISGEGKRYLLGTYSTLCKLPRIRVVEYQNKLALVWPKTMHAEHVKSIELINKSSPMSPVTITSLKNTDTMFFLDQSYFGITPALTLRYTPEIQTNDNTILCFESYYFTDRIELPGPNPMTMVASNCSELIYTRNDTLVGYSVEAKKTILAQPVGYQCAVSPDGNYSLQNINHAINFYSLSDYSLLKSIDMTNRFSYGYSVSNNGIGIYNTNEGLEIYDFRNNNLHLTNTKYSYSKGGYWPEISPDGNYVKFHKSQPYPNPNMVVFARIQGNSIIPMDSIEGPTCQFYKSDPSLFYYYKESTLYIRKIEDLSIVRTLYTGDEILGNIDFCSNRMITRGKETCHVYDILTGKLLFTIPMQNGDYVYLLNNIVYFEYGNKYLLPN